MRSEARPRSKQPSTCERTTRARARSPSCRSSQACRRHQVVVWATPAPSSRASRAVPMPRSRRSRRPASRSPTRLLRWDSSSTSPSLAVNTSSREFMPPTQTTMLFSFFLLRFRTFTTPFISLFSYIFLIRIIFNY